MLKELVIKNFLLIDYQEIPFTEGFNVITGETGTGKSLIIDALSLVLGGRAKDNLVRQGEESALVEALFSINQVYQVQKWLEEADLGLELKDEVILSREISQTGRTKARINGRVVAVGMLKQIESLLVDVSEQGVENSLFQPEKQLFLIDTFLDSTGQKTKEAYNQAWNRKVELTQKLEKLGDDFDQRFEEIQDKAKEFQELGLTVEEIPLIEEKFNRASNSQKSLELLEKIHLVLEGGEFQEGFLSQISALRKSLEDLSSQENQDIFSPLEEIFNNVEIELGEILYQAGEIKDKFYFSAEEIEEIENKILEIERLKRKYRCLTTQDFILLQNRTRVELSEMEELKKKKEKWGKELRETEEELWKLGRLLSESREKAAREMSKLLQKELKVLAFPKIEIEIILEKREKLTPSGINRVLFLVSFNPGEKPQPLSEVASGGELSRFILGIKSVISQTEAIPVLIFDEIDQGVGGETGFKIGEKLKKLSLHHQVICVTHLPQIACFADHHLQVEKRFSDQKTWAEVSILQEESGRVRELARMMGAERSVSSAENYAKLLLRKAKDESSKDLSFFPRTD
ncbi:MAG: repair protein RecN [Candidatus Atribacteria bacterium]|nr:repair protein RecN [Candidatus Atribacteria bacterium]